MSRALRAIGLLGSLNGMRGKKRTDDFSLLLKYGELIVELPGVFFFAELLDASLG